MARPVRVVPIKPHHDQIEAAYVLLSDMKPRKAKELCAAIYEAMVLHAPQHNRGGLSLRQRQVHEYCTAIIDDTGVAPTVREIAIGLGLKDHSYAWEALQALKRKGIVKRGPGWRDLEIVMRPEET